MTIAEGTRLGPYEVVSLLGAGGMGQVYRARDTRLDRSVAIKVLAPALAGDPEFRDRFEREARAISALNHPNVCTLYDVAPGYLVMELVDGESLENLIARSGRVAVREALRIARQVADALEAAHDRGIVHRDLKPANVRLTPSGQVKVLDFGLAKVLGFAASATPTLAGTMSGHQTAVGLVMGTAAYMSPEQARGMEVDRRTDVWAFGCVLYELLTGARPFDGATISDSIASLLTKDPDWTKLPPDTPVSVRRLLRRALEKDQTRRLRDIADARLDLDDTPDAVVPAPAAIPERGRVGWQRVLPAAGLVVAASTITAVAVWRNIPAAPVRATTRFSISLNPLRLAGTQRTVLALSPDGRMLAFSAAGPPSALYVRSMDSLETRPIRGTEGPTAPIGPVFSPDGQAIAYWSNTDQSLKRVGVGSGAPLTLCQTELPSGLTWSSDGIVFANTDGIHRVGPDGGEPELLVKATAGEIAFGARLLPGGRTVLFTAADAAGGSERWDAGRIVLQTLGAAERRTIITGGTDARYVESGHVVFARGGIVYAVPFDLTTLAVTGREVPVVEGVMRGTGTFGSGTINMTVSEEGTLAYLPGPLVPVATTSTMATFDVSGGSQPLPMPPGSYQTPRVSPDGRHIAFIIDDGRDVNVWVFGLGSDRAPRRLTFGGRNRSVAWSADSRRVAYRSDRDGEMAIYLQREDGAGAPEALTKPEKGTIDIPLSFSPDGAWLLFDRVAAGRTTLFTLSLSDRRIARFGTVDSSQLTGAVFTPDGKWVAYASRERGRSNQIYVEPFPATGAKYQVSNSSEDAHHPVWSPDGKTLFYTPGPGNRTIQVPVTFTPAVSFGAAAVLERPFTNLASSSDRPYDMMPDGRHFLSMMDPLLSETGLRSMTVVLNWFEELKARAPAGR